MPPVPTASTQALRRLVQLIRERFPDSEVRFVDTVCQPTKQRQQFMNPCPLMRTTLTRS